MRVDIYAYYTVTGPDVSYGVISGYFSLRLQDNDDVSVLEKNMMIIILPSRGVYYDNNGIISVSVFLPVGILPVIFKR